MDAFLASAKQTAEPLADGGTAEVDDRNCDVDGRCRTGPDSVVALLADEIIGAAFDLAREQRYVISSEATEDASWNTPAWCRASPPPVRNSIATAGSQKSPLM